MVKHVYGQVPQVPQVVARPGRHSVRYLILWAAIRAPQAGLRKLRSQTRVMLHLASAGSGQRAVSTERRVSEHQQSRCGR